MTMAYLSTVKAFSPQKLKKPTDISLLEISSSNQAKVKLTLDTCSSKYFSTFTFLSSIIAQAPSSYSLDVISRNLS